MYYIFIRLRNILTKDTLLTIYDGLVRSVLAYGVLIWGAAAKKYIKKVTTAQKAILKIIIKQNRRYPTDLLFVETGVWTLRRLYSEQLALYAFKFIFETTEPSHQYSTRHRDSARLPPARVVSLDKNHSVLALKIFKSLPIDAKQQRNKVKFKKQIKKWLKVTNDSTLNNILEM